MCLLMMALMMLLLMKMKHEDGFADEDDYNPQRLCYDVDGLAHLPSAGR